MEELTLKYGKVAVVGALSVGLLTGCFGEKPEENLYTAFETAATQEKSLVDEAKIRAVRETRPRIIFSNFARRQKIIMKQL